MIDVHLIDDGQIELIENNGLGYVRREFRMTRHDRHRPRAPALIGRRILIGTPQSERRDDIHRERRRMIIEHDEGDIGLELRDPLFGTFEP